MDRDNMKIGDTVSGTYHDVPFVAVISGFDSSFVYFDGEITVYGSKRDGFALKHRETTNLKLVEKGPELTDGDVSVHYDGTVTRRK